MLEKCETFVPSRDSNSD